MPYVTRAQITAKVPEPVLLDALDDNRDGQEDAGVLGTIIANASQEVDGYLGGLFTVPFPDPAPPKVCQAALIFSLEQIYGRRESGNEAQSGNPWKSQAKFWREHLQRVGNRELPFDASQTKAFSPGAGVTEPVSADAQST